MEQSCWKEQDTSSARDVFLQDGAPAYRAKYM